MPSLETLEKENRIHEISDKQKYLFQVAIMKKMLGEHPSMNTELEFANTYAVLLSDIIKENEHIKELISEDPYNTEAINEIIAILKKVQN